MKLICEKISLIVWNWRGTDVIVEANFIDATPSFGNLLLHPLRWQKNAANSALRLLMSYSAI